MEMVFRWFGEEENQVPLKHIKQIPGVSGVVWALHDIPTGEAWPLDRIEEVKRNADSYGLNIDVVESLNIHEDIKLGLPSRDEYIRKYIKTMERLSMIGVKVICYNFMPVFDWIRTDLFKAHEDGSTAMFYDRKKIENVDPMELVKSISYDSTYSMPGWEPERLQYLSDLFLQYKNVTTDMLWDNLEYFLEAVIPAAERLDIKLAIHPDDPPYSVFNLPRIVTGKDSLDRILNLVDSPNNGLTFCSGSLGVNPDNDLVDIVKTFSDRIHFAHVRNLKYYDNGNFIESSHLVSDGSLDIPGIMKAFHDAEYKGYIRPDHGRHIWDEECRPGYGLYDRALGVMYLWGLWDSQDKEREGVGVNDTYQSEFKG